MFFIKDIFLCDEDNILPFITDSLEFWQKQTEINNVVVSHVNVSVVRIRRRMVSNRISSDLCNILVTYAKKLGEVPWKVDRGRADMIKVYQESWGIISGILFP